MEETLARAAHLQGDRVTGDAQVMQARVFARAIVDVDQRRVVDSDLETLRSI